MATSLCVLLPSLGGERDTTTSRVVPCLEVGWWFLWSEGAAGNQPGPGSRPHSGQGLRRWFIDPSIPSSWAFSQGWMDEYEAATRHG